ncbi:MAG: DUF4298 domain-containing protein [Oscillospiraceae bacterium]|nr:DUF4298 domain-containing protein [Oscillospiraceae bacterium]
MEQIERITYYEGLLDRVSAANAGLERALAEYRDAQAAARELDTYYGGEEWKQDFADDEAGKLPRTLKRGVLSEDAAYDALCANRALLTQMLETVAQALRD